VGDPDVGQLEDADDGEGREILSGAHAGGGEAGLINSQRRFLCGPTAGQLITPAIVPERALIEGLPTRYPQRDPIAPRKVHHCL
jgi:hypothetical protein